MSLISLYCYKTPDTIEGQPVSGRRMGTPRAIAHVCMELIPEDTLRVRALDLNDDGWTMEGYWYRNRPPVYM